MSGEWKRVGGEPTDGRRKCRCGQTFIGDEEFCGFCLEKLDNYRGLVEKMTPTERAEEVQRLFGRVERDEKVIKQEELEILVKREIPTRELAYLDEGSMRRLMAEAFKQGTKRRK